MDSEYKVIKQNAAYEQIIDQIMRKIHSGMLKAGDLLPPERELAKAMGVNRHTIREGLVALEYMGILERKVGVGTLVKNVGQDILIERIVNAPQFSSLGFLEELTELRMALEPSITAIAAERASEEQIGFIENAMKDLETMIDDPVKMNAAHMRFHLGIAEATGNSTILTLMKPILLMHTEYREQIVYSENRKGEMLKEHRLIWEAVKNKDSKAAQKAMLSHLTSLEKIHRKLNKSKQAGVSLNESD